LSGGKMMEFAFIIQKMPWIGVHFGMPLLKKKMNFCVCIMEQTNFCVCVMERTNFCVCVMERTNGSHVLSF